MVGLAVEKDVNLIFLEIRGFKTQNFVLEKLNQWAKKIMKAFSRN